MPALPATPVYPSLTKVTVVASGSSDTVTRHPMHAIKFQSTADPTAGNDTVNGYQVGDLWVNTTTGACFVSISVAEGAAVWQGVSSGFSKVTVATGTYAILTTDNIINCTSGTFTATLPTAVGFTGKTFTVKNSGAGVVTVATTGGQTIDGVATWTLNTNDALTIFSDGSNWKVF